MPPWSTFCSIVRQMLSACVRPCAAATLVAEQANLEAPAWDLAAESFLWHLFSLPQLSICSKGTIVLNPTPGRDERRQATFKEVLVVQIVIGGLSTFVTRLFPPGVPKSVGRIEKTVFKNKQLKKY